MSNIEDILELLPIKLEEYMRGKLCNDVMGVVDKFLGKYEIEDDKIMWGDKGGIYEIKLLYDCVYNNTDLNYYKTYSNNNEIYYCNCCCKTFYNKNKKHLLTKLHKKNKDKMNPITKEVIDEAYKDYMGRGRLYEYNVNKIISKKLLYVLDEDNEIKLVYDKRDKLDISSGRDVYIFNNDLHYYGKIIKYLKKIDLLFI